MLERPIHHLYWRCTSNGSSQATFPSVHNGSTRELNHCDTLHLEHAIRYSRDSDLVFRSPAKTDHFEPAQNAYLDSAVFATSFPGSHDLIYGEGFDREGYTFDETNTRGWASKEANQQIIVPENEEYSNGFRDQMNCERVYSSEISMTSSVSENEQSILCGVGPVCEQSSRPSFSSSTLAIGNSG